jgi:hypothetical protein
MNPLVTEVEEPQDAGELGSIPWSGTWAGFSSHLEDLRRITACLPSSKKWSDAVVPAGRGAKIDEDLDFGRFREMAGVAVIQSAPKWQANSTRELIKVVQQEAEDRRLRQVARLQNKIDALERELASVREEAQKIDLGNVVVVHGISIPKQLRTVATAVLESRKLLELDDDWDDDGAAGFTEATWHRAACFLVRNAVTLACKHGPSVGDVEILPGSNGGLDIDWRLGDRELLIVVPSDPKSEARFYGDNGREGRQIKGTLDTSDVPAWLLMWMTE